MERLTAEQLRYDIIILSYCAPVELRSEREEPPSYEQSHQPHLSQGVAEEQWSQLRGRKEEMEREKLQERERERERQGEGER